MYKFFNAILNLCKKFYPIITKFYNGQSKERFLTNEKDGCCTYHNDLYFEGFSSLDDHERRVCMLQITYKQQGISQTYYCGITHFRVGILYIEFRYVLLKTSLLCQYSKSETNKEKRKLGILIENYLALVHEIFLPLSFGESPQVKQNR